jgi:hypothetical protein
MLHTKLLLPQPFAQGYNVNSWEKTRRVQLLVSTHINPEIISMLGSVGIKIMLAELFYSPPNFVSFIHADTYANDIAKINWVFCSSVSYMNWYHPLVKKESIKPGSHAFIPYKPDEVELIESCCITSPSLIQAAVPHNITNGEKDRWAVSLMLADSITSQQISITDSFNRLQSIKVVE